MRGLRGGSAREGRREDLTLSLWSEGPQKLAEFPAKYRLVPGLPYLKQWGT